MKKIIIAGILLVAVFYGGKAIYSQGINKQSAQVSASANIIASGQLLTTTVPRGGNVTFKLVTGNGISLTDSQLSKLYIEPIGPNKPIMTITRAGIDTYAARIPADFPLGSYEVSIFPKLNSGTDMDWYFNETLTVTAAPAVSMNPATPSAVNASQQTTVQPVATPAATTNGVTDVVVDATDHNATIKFKVNKGIMQAKIKYKDSLTGVYKSGDNVRQESPQSSVYVAYLDVLTPNTSYAFNIELVDFDGKKVTLPTEYSFKTVARFVDSNLYKRQIEKLKNFTVSAKPVNQTANPGLYNLTWNNAVEDVCVYIDAKSTSKAYVARKPGTATYNPCFAGSTGSAQIQVLQKPENGSTKTSSIKFDLKVRPSLSAGTGNFTLPSGFEYAQFSGTYREKMFVFDNSVMRVVKDVQLPAVGPKTISIDKTNVKPGDIVTVKVNDFFDLGTYPKDAREAYGNGEVLLTTSVSKFHDLYASGYHKATAPITSIDLVNKTISFKIADTMSYVYKNQYNVAATRVEFHEGDYYVILKNGGVLNPSALKINIKK